MAPQAKPGFPFGMAVLVLIMGGFFSFLFAEGFVLGPRGREEFRDKVLATIQNQDYNLSRATVEEPLLIPTKGTTLWLDRIGGSYISISKTASCPPCYLEGRLSKHVLQYPTYILPGTRKYGALDLSQKMGIPAILYITETGYDRRKGVAYIEYVVIPSSLR